MKLSTFREVSRAQAAGKTKTSKYGNRKVEVDGLKFDSNAEYLRWRNLKLMEKAGAISKLERQVRFILAPAVLLYGRRRPAMIYVADFVYLENGERVVEDVKGHRTPLYLAKRHLMRAVHNVEIREVEA